MAYGIQKADIPKIKHPKSKIYSIGRVRLCVTSDKFSLIRLDNLKKFEGWFKSNYEFYFYVSSGFVTVNYIRNKKEYSVEIFENHSFKFKKDDKLSIRSFYPKSVLFFFSSINILKKNLFKELKNKPPKIKSPRKNKATRNYDFRDKYWGSIETIFSDDRISGKIMMAKKDITGSLEYHLNKYESYYIEEGSLKVGLRIGRAENISVNLKKNNSFSMFPGLMHCRMAIEDVKIIEISTKDEDSDSYLVEDGRYYKHIEKK